MPFDPPVAVYDACVLYPFHLRNVLIQCAFDGLIEARWTNDIHDEWIRNLVANTPALSIERLLATRDKMNAVLPEANVANYRPLLADLHYLILTIDTRSQPPSPGMLPSSSPGTSRISRHELSTPTE